jgi:hypothetical protein
MHQKRAPRVAFKVCNAVGAVVRGSCEIATAAQSIAGAVVGHDVIGKHWEGEMFHFVSSFGLAALLPLEQP